MSDVFRTEYKELPAHISYAVLDVKQNAKVFLNVIEDVCPVSRERSLAITKLEEAVFWATKGLTA